MSVVDFLDDPAFAGLDNIGPVVTLDIAILTQPRRLPIHLIGERPYLDGERQAVRDADARGSDASRGALLGSVRTLLRSRRTRVLANGLSLSLSEKVALRGAGGGAVDWPPRGSTSTIL
jgi:hypothetical protein